MESNYRSQLSKVEKDEYLDITDISPRPPLSSQSVSPTGVAVECEMVERIIDRDRLIAIIISQKFDRPGTNFFTPNELSQQLGYMRHPVGKVIQPHIHNPLLREVQRTQEVLIIRQGKLRVDLYDIQQHYLVSRILTAGDVILLVAGGHGFEVLEAIDMIEVKQGPYVGDRDITSFVGISAAQANLKG